MSSTTAARRYAKALFELCVEQQAVEPVRADLEHLVKLLAESTDWNSFVHSPIGSDEMRSSTLQHLLDGQAHELTSRFLAFASQKRRINLLASIYEEWLKLYDESKGNLRAVVVTSSPLEPGQIKDLTARLTKRYGKNVILSARIDTLIIGGLKVFVADQVLDYSIETQLQRLRKRLVYA
jgi:F-type H+-transporting ATPase subunit delta